MRCESGFESVTERVWGRLFESVRTQASPTGRGRGTVEHKALLEERDGKGKEGAVKSELGYYSNLSDDEGIEDESAFADGGLLQALGDGKGDGAFRGSSGVSAPKKAKKDLKKEKVLAVEAKNNEFGNPFGSEIALFRTSEGGMSRMAVCWDMPSGHGEKGRVYGQKPGKGEVETARPPLPPGMSGGGHGGSHGLLTDEFIDAILRGRKPWVDVVQALNMTVAGIVAHQSALKDGELLKIPQYVL